VATSSARPDDLEEFARLSHVADRRLLSHLKELGARYNTFLSENEWGVFDATSLVQAFGRYLQGNDFSARWVGGIAAAFRHAGGAAGSCGVGLDAFQGGSRRRRAVGTGDR